MTVLVWASRAVDESGKREKRIVAVVDPLDYKDATERALCEMGIQGEVTVGELLALESGAVKCQTGWHLEWLVIDGTYEIE